MYFYMASIEVLKCELKCDCEVTEVIDLSIKDDYYEKYTLFSLNNDILMILPRVS